MRNLLLVILIILVFSIVGYAAKSKGVYIGEKKDGKRHGQGTVTFSDGSKYSGEFKNGRPWNVQSFNDSGEQQTIVFNNGIIGGI